MSSNNKIISGLVKFLFFSSEQNNDELLKLRKRYRDLEKSKISITHYQGEILKKMQDKCSHSNIAQIGANDYSFVKFDMSKRICENCGYEECGWPGVGYKKLKIETGRTINNVNKEEFNKYRIPFIA
jgi:hypothetical protein